MRLCSSLLVAMMLFIAQQSLAAVFLQGGYSQNFANEEEGDSSKYFSRDSNTQVSGGVELGGFAVGASYHFEEHVIFGSQAKVLSYGPSAGYIHVPTGIFVLGTYLINPRFSYVDDPEKRYGGNGYVAELGKVWKLYGQLNVGLEIVTTRLFYKKTSDEDHTTGLIVEKDEATSDSQTKPMLTLAYWL